MGAIVNAVSLKCDEPGLETGALPPRLLAYANQPTPRYTSYPTAPYFDALVTPSVHEKWLGDLTRDAAVSLYIHVPYCREICTYCACHTFALKRDWVLEKYLDTLKKEIRLLGALTGARSIKEVHWGGGTPNMLSPEQFNAVLSELNAAFDMRRIAQHSIEIDPRTLSAAQVDAYVSGSVNRVSLGVQDLNPHVQEKIGRIQPFETVRDAVDGIRRGGIKAVNFDVMYGLPGQSLQDLENTIQKSLSLAPQRLALFGYAHVPWFKARQRLISADELPDAELRWAQINIAGKMMSGAGYTAIGFDHFALPTDPLAIAARARGLHRNFQGYVDDDCAVLIGLGPSAISTLPQGYAQNAAEVGAWSRAIADRKLSTSRGRLLTEDDKMRRAIIEELLCNFEVDLGRFGGIEKFQREHESIKRLQTDGLIDLVGERIAVARDARQFVRVVAKAFDAYDGAARHSRSV